MKNKLLILSVLITLTTQFIAAQVPSYVPTNGMIGYWSFTGNANDSSPNANNGIVTGATLITDRFGNLNSAYSFNGLNNYIDFPQGSSSTLNVIGDISYCYWIKTTQITLGLITAFGEETAANPGGYLSGLADGPNAEPGKLSFEIGGTWAKSTIMLNDNAWHQVIITLNSQTLRLYVDGLLNVERPNVIPTTSWNGIRRMGSANYNSIGFYNGFIDDFGLWNRALTQEEITGLYYAENACQSLVINTGILGFNPVAYTNTVTIYPNPAHDQITIDCGNLANVSGWYIKIVNTLGQEVFNGAMNTPQYVVPLNSWSGQGIYFVKIYDSSNNLLNTKKIILQ